MSARPLHLLAAAPGAAVLLAAVLLALGSCRSTEKAAGPPEAAYGYPLTMRAEVAGVLGAPEPEEGDALIHVALWNRDGQEFISGMFDTSAGTFVEESLFLFGMLPEELEAQEMGSITTRVREAERDFLLGCDDPEVRWLFLEAQGPRSDGESTGREQLLLAFGGVVALLSPRDEATAPDAPGADPCEPLEDKDYCTWAPEFYQQSCCKHDECYAGCPTTGTTRLACDQAFRDDMRAEASVWTRPFVPVYYGAVRAFGREFFPCN